MNIFLFTIEKKTFQFSSVVLYIFYGEYLLFYHIFIEMSLGFKF